MVRTPPVFAILLAAAAAVGCAGNRVQAQRYANGGSPPPVASPAPAPGAAPYYGPGPSTSPVAYAGRPPAPVMFRFQVGDVVATSVWKESDLSAEQKILSDGTISPPLLKVMRVVGMSVDELQSRLIAGYSEYLKEPKVSVRVVAIHSDRVFVLGEVRNPQAVPLVGPTTVVEAIAQAGGFQEEFADTSSVRLVRRGQGGDPDVTMVNACAILAGQDADVPLRRGDIVFVPARGITEWSRTMGQLLSPFSTALLSAGSAVAIQQAVK